MLPVRDLGKVILSISPLLGCAQVDDSQKFYPDVSVAIDKIIEHHQAVQVSSRVSRYILEDYDINNRHLRVDYVDVTPFGKSCGDHISQSYTVENGRFKLVMQKIDFLCD